MAKQLYRYATDDEIAGLLRGPSQQQTQLYNALGRNAGMADNGDSDNFFVKRGKSIENALGTTGAALYETGGNLLGAAISGLTGSDYTSKKSAEQNEKTERLRKDTHANMNNVAKGFGYDSWADWQDANDLARESGDTELIKKFDEQAKAFQKQANENASAVKKNADDYNDYVKNNYASKKINQDPGKFAGSAINTLSTAADVALPAAGVAFNTVQGGVEGIADELEQNGIKNFDWGRAGQNALVGATTGAVVGGLNKGVNGVLAKRGGNLLKGGNKLTKAINNFNANNALGQVASTVGTGAARGALSGTVGGATGAGLSAALNGQDVLASAVEGAKRGATQGALAGGVMSGANLALSKTPGVGNVMQNLNEAGENWKQSGDNFNERLTNTINSGDSKIGNWLNRRTNSRLLASAGNIGNSVADVNTNAIDPWDRVAQQSGYNNYDEVIDRFMEANPNIEINQNGMAGQVLDWLDKNPNTPTTAGGWLKRAGERIVEDANNRGVGLGVRDISEEMPADILNMRIQDNNKVATLDTLNPTGTIQTEYDPTFRANAPLGGKLTTYDKTANIAPDQEVTIYRGVPNNASDTMNAGDYVTTNRQLAQDYAGNGKVIAQKVPASSLIDDMSEPLGEEYIYRPQDVQTIEQPTMQTRLAQQIEEIPRAGQEQTTSTPETEVFNQLSNKTSREAQLRNASGLKLQQQYGTIDKPTAKATNAPETLQKIKNAGFIKPADVERMADVITGSNGEVSKLVSNLVQTAKPVNTFDGETQGQTLKDYIDLAVQKRGLNGINEGKAVKSQIDALMKSLPSHADGSITFEDNPQDVFKLTQMLDSEAAQYEGRSGMNYGTTTPDKLRAAQVIKDVSNLLKDRVYSTVDVKKALTPDVAENLKSYAPNNKEFADYVDNTIMKAQNVADLRSAQAPWVRAKKIIDNGYMNSITYGGRMGNSTTIPATKRGLTTAALNATINSGPGLRAQSKILDKAADWVAKRDGGSNNTTALVAATDTPMAANNTPATQIYNMIGRTEGNLQNEQARSAEYLANAAQEGEIVQNDNNMLVPDTGTSLYDQFYGTGGNATDATLANNTTSNKAGYFEKTGDYWTDLLANAMSSAIDADDVNAFAALYGMYQDALSSKAKSNEKDYNDLTNWNSTDRSKLLSVQDALGQIDLLESSYNNATGGDGGNWLQGGLRNVASNILSGNLDPSASNYNKQAESIGMGIVKNMINLGVTEADAKRYLEYLPALTDTKEQAADKLAKLRAAYQNQINNLYASYGL